MEGEDKEKSSKEEEMKKLEKWEDNEEDVKREKEQTIEGETKKEHKMILEDEEKNEIQKDEKQKNEKQKDEKQKIESETKRDGTKKTEIEKQMEKHRNKQEESQDKESQDIDQTAVKTDTHEKSGYSESFLEYVDNQIKTIEANVKTLQSFEEKIKKYIDVEDENKMKPEKGKTEADEDKIEAKEEAKEEVKEEVKEEAKKEVKEEAKEEVKEQKKGKKDLKKEKEKKKKKQEKKKQKKEQKKGQKKEKNEQEECTKIYEENIKEKSKGNDKNDSEEKEDKKREPEKLEEAKDGNKDGNKKKREEDDDKDKDKDKEKDKKKETKQMADEKQESKTENVKKETTEAVNTGKNIIKEEEKEEKVEEKINAENLDKQKNISNRTINLFENYEEEEKLEKEKNEKFLQAFFQDSDIDSDVDVWKELDYISVEPVEMLDIEDESNSFNKFNEMKEAKEEMNKKRLKRRFRDKTHDDELKEKEKEKEDEKEMGKKKEGEINTNESNGKPKMLDVIDKPFILIPLRGILNTFRHMQKELEKNVMIITLFIEKKLLHLTKDITIQKLNTIIEKLTALKGKINESKKTLNRLLKSIYKRLESIYQEADIQLENLKKDFQFETYENRLNWLIDEYLSRYGYFETEEIFCKRYKLQNYTDVDIYKEFVFITKELQKKNTKPALDWCQKYKSQLKKININVEAELHLLNVINLILQRKYVDSIIYIQKNITDPGKGVSSNIKYLITHIGLNRNVVSLESFNKKGWKRAIRKFKNVYSEITGMIRKPILELLLKAGISVIKTESCGIQKSTKCPTCIDELKTAIKMLPNIQKTRSFLVCPYTNEVMDENNPPYTTPSGHVFSKKAIYLFSKVDGMFECPITEETHRFSDFSRLFI